MTIDSSGGGVDGVNGPYENAANGTEKVVPVPTLQYQLPTRHRGQYYYPSPDPWNPYRSVKVIITGAGIGGVGTAALLSQKTRNLEIAVYDRYDRVGGTWATNVYPGVRCDVPSHSYQLSFEPNTEWSEYYPKGAEIQQYYERVVAKYGLADSVHLRHEILDATWLPHKSQWEVRIKNLDTDQVFVDRADFFISAQGRISKPKWPEIPGLLDNFKGNVIHTARWPKDFDYRGKRIAVIGNGASGAQVIPNILPDVARIDHYVRTKTWVTPSFARGLLVAEPGQPGGPKYTEEQREIFRNDPAAYLEHRRAFDLELHPRAPGGDILGSKANRDAREATTKAMLDRVGGDEAWLARILPDYAPGCKRPTPSPGYIEALLDPKVDYVTTRIELVEETGIVTADGKLREVDVIVTATGFENGFVSLFPVIGVDGVDLREKWGPKGEVGYPESYLGVMAPGYPNYFTVLQAQGNGGGGTVPLHIEVTATYIAKVIRKIQAESYLSLNPRQEAAEDFNDIVSSYYVDRVMSDHCSSWFKTGAGPSRVLIGWPGTYHHRAAVLREPRWEDFEFARAPSARRNRFDFFANGFTERERARDERDVTNYLREVGKIDVATIHEAWNE